MASLEDIKKLFEANSLERQAQFDEIRAGLNTFKEEINTSVKAIQEVVTATNAKVEELDNKLQNKRGRNIRSQKRCGSK